MEVSGGRRLGLARAEGVRLYLKELPSLNYGAGSTSLPLLKQPGMLQCLFCQCLYPFTESKSRYAR